MRAFLVARRGLGAAIREVEPGTNAYEYTREDAWAMAVRMSTKVTQKTKIRSALGPIHYTDLAGTVTLIPTETQVA